MASYNYRGVKFWKELAAGICSLPDLQIDVEISGPFEMLVALYQTTRCHYMEACNLYSQHKINLIYHKNFALTSNRNSIPSSFGGVVFVWK
jgi:hypothetical protein